MTRRSPCSTQYRRHACRSLFCAYRFMNRHHRGHGARYLIACRADFVTGCILLRIQSKRRDVPRGARTSSIDKRRDYIKRQSWARDLLVAHLVFLFPLMPPVEPLVFLSFAPLDLSRPSGCKNFPYDLSRYQPHPGPLLSPHLLTLPRPLRLHHPLYPLPALPQLRCRLPNGVLIHVSHRPRIAAAIAFP